MAGNEMDETFEEDSERNRNLRKAVELYVAEYVIRTWNETFQIE
jgi:hypothetical protein